ncbi:hypothetical protein TNCV_715341 [Trichonephila clavipes]|nr:hypothetical protein TNCV_715341 [Trichonephila clavipes]
MTYHNRLGNFLKWSTVGRTEASQPQAEVPQWLQVTGKWSPGYGSNSKKNLRCHREGRPSSTESIDIWTVSLLGVKRTMTKADNGSSACS